MPFQLMTIYMNICVVPPYLTTVPFIDYVPATQYGSFPDQCPLSRQYRWLSPTIVKSHSQVYSATKRSIAES